MLKRVVDELDAISRAMRKAHSTMNERLIESSKQLIALFKKHADDLDQLADACSEPERSYYRNKAESSRFEVRDEEVKLKALENA